MFVPLLAWTSSSPCPVFFFFSSRRRHTRCLSDWSSDVCSSDLLSLSLVAELLLRSLSRRGYSFSSDIVALLRGVARCKFVVRRSARLCKKEKEIGRASCRERV